jgi:hypothetical protein
VKTPSQKRLFRAEGSYSTDLLLIQKNHFNQITMLLFNEKNEQLNIEDVKAKLRNLDSIPVPTEQEVTDSLGNYYNQSFELQRNTLQIGNEMMPSLSLTGLGGIGKKILDQIRKIICGILNGSSTQGDILDAILKALASIIPGGIFIETLAKMLVKFILSKGIVTFCAIQAQ